MITFYAQFTGMKKYTVDAEGLKLQPLSKYHLEVKGNACEEWIKEMHLYISYYKNRNIFSDKTEKTGFASRILKRYCQTYMDCMT